MLLKIIRLFVIFILPFLFIFCASETELQKPSISKKTKPLIYQPKKLPSLDSKALVGRTIVLDPGHGGVFSGAIGRKGMKEKDANLRVALSVKSKLEALGSNVFLTRETDKDFLTQTGQSVKDDLKYRFTFSDSVNPDLFISLHHNASDTAGKQDSLGDISKTFYKLGDDGPSLDAAIKVHSEFVSLLGFTKNELSLGNYSVLRNTRVPALLGEPSYITNPDVETRLGDSAGIDIEAECYVRGIAAYFASGTPKILSVSYDSTDNLLVTDLGGDGPFDSASVDAKLDGKILISRIANSHIYCPTQSPLTNGRHKFVVALANVRGNLSMQREFTISVDRVPAVMNALITQDAGKSGQIVPVRISVFDAYGLPVIDGTPVNAGANNTAETRGGIATLYLPFCGYPIPVQCAGLSAVVKLKNDPKGEVHAQGFIKSQNRPVSVIAIDSMSGSVFSSDVNGFLDLPGASKKLTIKSDGFADTSISFPMGILNNVELRKMYDGALAGKKIMIDPEFGGMETGPISRIGTRSSDVTRKFARELVLVLRQAGADATLAREGDRSVHQGARVEEANANGTEIYIVIRAGVGKSSPFVAYYPGNQMGKKFATYLKEFYNNALSITEENSFITQQTPCTSAVVSILSLESGDPFDTAVQKKGINAIVGSLVKYFKK